MFPVTAELPWTPLEERNVKTEVRDVNSVSPPSVTGTGSGCSLDGFCAGFPHCDPLSSIILVTLELVPQVVRDQSPSPQPTTSY